MVIKEEEHVSMPRQICLHFALTHPDHMDLFESIDSYQYWGWWHGWTWTICLGKIYSALVHNNIVFCVQGAQNWDPRAYPKKIIVEWWV